MMTSIQLFIRKLVFQVSFSRKESSLLSSVEWFPKRRCRIGIYHTRWKHVGQYEIDLWQSYWRCHSWQYKRQSPRWCYCFLWSVSRIIKTDNVSSYNVHQKPVLEEISSVASALDHFLDQVQFLAEKADDVMYFGINGGYRRIPEGLVVRNALVGSTDGINSAMHEWGHTLRRWHGKDVHRRQELGSSFF